MIDENVPPVNLRKAGAFILRLAVILGVVAACVTIPILIPFVLLGLAKKSRLKTAPMPEEGNSPRGKPEI